MRSATTAVILALLALSLAACQPQDGGANGAFGGKARMDKALRGQIYYLPAGTPKLPDFATLRPVGSVYARELNVPDQAFTVGFPGVTNRFEWFAIDYKGAFSVDKPGDYGFRLSSDDGSRLFIDGNAVIDNDGQHPTTSVSGRASLAPGRHAIEVRYFQGPANRVSLQLFCTRAGGVEAIFPACGLNLARTNVAPWWVWMAALAVIAVVVAVLRAGRGRPPAAPP